MDTSKYLIVTIESMIMMILLCHLFLFVVKPKCPPYSYTVTGDICICNPGYYMNNTGKRACIRKYSVMSHSEREENNFVMLLYSIKRCEKNNNM